MSRRLGLHDYRVWRGVRAHKSTSARWAVLGAAAVVAVAAPAPAAGAPAVPGAETVVLFDAPAGEFCEFPVRLALRDGTKLHDTDSILFSTGALSVTITNLDSGEAQTFNASGPTFRNGVLAGTAIILQPASRNVGPPFMILSRGRATFTEQNTIDTITGSQVDICAALS